MTGVGRIEATKDLLRRADCVCFDVDSTVSPDEGIDVLAAVAGKAAEVAALTASAMGGSVPFEVALLQRMDLIRPSRQLLANCLRQHPPRLNPGIDRVVALLHRRGCAVHLVSGGFEPMILPLAEKLGIAADRVHANRIRHHDDGSYRDFDPEVPTSRSGGKARLVGLLKERFAYHTALMVGDGATDLEARPPADAFIGYGGIAVREKVRAGADWFVTDFADLIAVLEG